MSEPGKAEYYCKKCGALVTPTDEKCPNGHVLKEVGRSIKLLLEEKLTLSDQKEIRLSKVEENLLKRIAGRIIESLGADSLTIKLPLVNITFDKSERAREV